jgi:hypothetical protein
MYLKITNAKENHFGLQYHDGLNIDPLPFAKEGSCCTGGIYFTTPEYICRFLYVGIYIREVIVPEDAEMVLDPQGDKWRASKVTLFPRKDLREVNTWKWLVKNKVNIFDAFTYAYIYGHTEVAEYLFASGAYIHAYDEELKHLESI